MLTIEKIKELTKSYKLLFTCIIPTVTNPKFLIIIITLIAFPHEINAQFNVSRLPSEAAGTEGIVLRITAPDIARYSSGAPVVVRVPGGTYGDGLSEMKINLSEFGFIEIAFNFPGSGDGIYKSGGEYDYRGINCIKALRDVILFSQGKLTLKSGQFLHDYLNTIKPLYENVGVVGFSNGGNTILCCAGIYGNIFNELNWIINWESPVGDGIITADAGTWSSQDKPKNPLINPAYNPDNGEFDLSSVAYSDEIIISNIEGKNYSAVNGGIFFDFNRDSIVDENVDYVALPFVVTLQDTPKAFYSSQLMAHVTGNSLLPDPPPQHIPTLSEAKEFWNLRNGEEWIDSISIKIPDLCFMIVASDTDHYQTALDHPHILLQYEMLRNAQTKFVRLNPDRAYVENLLGYSFPPACDNEANIPFDHFTIRNVLEPETDSTNNPLEKNIVVAAACEMADRTLHNNFSPQLNSILGETNEVDVETKNSINFILYQNYPNPFNPSTCVQFYLGESMDVDLTIFNILGKKITTLFHGFAKSGYHKLKWIPTDIPSGVYLCRLEIFTPVNNPFVKLKKIIFMK